MSMSRDLIALTIHNRDAGALNQALTIVFPEQMKDKELIIHEYDGYIPRLFGDDRTIELMLPSDMDTVVENAVVEAINNGTLFDDAEHVNNTASYITMTSYPLSGMSNRGKNEPVSIKHAIGSVVGAMNDEGRFGRDECDAENGTNFAHDIVKHGKDKDSSVNDLVDSYLDAKNHNKLSLGYRRSLNGVYEEIDDINDVAPEDSISQSDIDNGFSASKILGGKVESKGECGDVEAFDEDGEIEPGETDYTPTDNVSTMTEQAIYNEFGIRFNELDELYQELDFVYASMDPTEKEYYMETGEVSDANKESKIKSTWEKIKQWFRRTFLVIISNFEKLEINNRTKSINKALDAGRSLGILKDMPDRPLTDDEFERVKEAWKFLLSNTSNDANKIKQHTQVLKSACDKYKACIEKEKTILNNAKKEPSKYTIYTKSSNSILKKNINENTSNVEMESKIISGGIKAFKLWNKENRDNEEFDEQLWREYFEYYIKSITSIITELKYYMRSIKIFTDEDMEELKKAGKLVGDVKESYADEVYDEYIQEGLFRRPKKLKPIPRDVVAYITVEMNAIKDSNDQAMLAGYTCSKLELVDFYITCIDTQDDRYIVPHTRQYLVQMQDDLNRLLTQILRIKPVNRNDRMWKVILPEGRF